MLAVGGGLPDNQLMGFAEEFYKLDPAMVEQAYANASEELMIIAKRDDRMGERTADMFAKIEEASPGFMALIGRYEEAIQLITDLMETVPGIRDSETRFRLTEMMLGSVSIGLVLAEYARLEQEQTP